MKRSRRPLPLLLALAALVWWLGRGQHPAHAPPAGDDLARFFAAHRSHVTLTVTGTVDRTLPDDRTGDRHQRFILRPPGGPTVLVAHNIDIAPRVPLVRGDTVTVRGEYVWNEKGGVIHWTHHDPAGRREGGWVDHSGHRYR